MMKEKQRREDDESALLRASMLERQEKLKFGRALQAAQKANGRGGNMPISEKRGIVRALPDFVWGKYSRLKTIKNLVRSFIQSGRKANGIQVK